MASSKSSLANHNEPSIDTSCHRVMSRFVVAACLFVGVFAAAAAVVGSCDVSSFWDAPFSVLERMLCSSFDMGRCREQNLVSDQRALSLSSKRAPSDNFRRLEDEQQNDGNGNNAQERGEPGNDDFFNDFIQDDLIASDSKIDPYHEYETIEEQQEYHLFPLETQTVVGYFVAALALGLGASSGTGGGGTIVPIYILIMQLPIVVAIPIGAVTVLGGALASTCFNWTRRHPLADRVLIDWDFVLVRP